MGWAGTFVLGRGYAAYFGKAGANTAHQHAAIQLVLSSGGDVTIHDRHGECIRAKNVLIRPLTQHTLQGIADLVSIYIEPQTEFGKSLLEEANPNGISAFEGVVFKEWDPDLILRKLDTLSSEMSTTIDARLQDAMNFLNQADTRPTISEAAKSCGISVSTLRLLAKRDLGLPLATWLVWKKLGRAAKALSKETSLAEAAYAGGFADQAHLCRVMKRLFGITPKTAARIMKWRIRDESIYIPSSL